MKYAVRVKPTVYIYGLIQTSTNELFYVGQPHWPEDRFKGHRNSTAKDIKDDCHMVFLETGPDLTTEDEYFWIEYARFLGAPLRNKRVRTPKCSVFHSHGGGPAPTYIFPHLAEDIAAQGTTAEAVAAAARVDKKTIHSAVCGERLYWWDAARIDKVLSYGTAMCGGLSTRRFENLVRGWTTPKYVEKENHRRLATGRPL